MIPTTLITKYASILAPFAIAMPIVMGGGLGHHYGDGHAEMVWTTSGLWTNGTASVASVTSNLPTNGEAIMFGAPITSLTLDVRRFPAKSVTGTLVIEVPASTDPWWSTYPGPTTLPGITTGGTLELTLTGQADSHTMAASIYGTYTITAATGQYAGWTGSGDFSGASTGGPSAFGQFYDFALIGSHR